MVLKPSEKRLLIVFGIAIFLIGNIAAWSILQEKDIKVNLNQIKLEKELKRLQALQSQAPLAREYEAAMTKYLTRYDSLDTRDTYLPTFVQNGANSHDLKLSKNAPLATEGADEGEELQFIKSGYQAEVTGEWTDVLEFLHTLQEPTEFRYVKTLTLSVRKSEEGDGASELSANFVLQKWWHPESDRFLEESTTTAAAPAPPAAPENKPAEAPAVSVEQPTSPEVKPSASPASPASTTVVAPTGNGTAPTQQ